MELVVFDGIPDLLELIRRSLDSSSHCSGGESTSSISQHEELSSLQRILERDETLSMAVVIRILKLAYGSSINEATLRIAAPIHECLYNSCIKDGLGYLNFIFKHQHRDQQDVIALLAALIPDPEIRTAMLNGEATVVEAAASVPGQLGYLFRRVEPLRKLIDIFRELRGELPIARPEAFSHYLRVMDGLGDLGEMLAQYETCFGDGPTPE